MLDYIRQVISSDGQIAAAMILMAALLLPAYKTKLGDKGILVTAFIAHLIFQLSPIEKGSVYTPYIYAMLIDMMIYILCFLLAYRGMILAVGFLSLACVAVNLFQVCCLIVADGDITSYVFLDFVYETQPYILLITFTQTLLLAWETYGRDLKRHMVLLLRRYTFILSDSLDGMGRDKANKESHTET